MRIYLSAPLYTPYQRAFIEQCAARVRSEGFEVFVPHEHEFLPDADQSAAGVFAKDRVGIDRSEVLFAIIDGAAVDDGTACEIGMFHALARSDPTKRGIVGLLTDIRLARQEIRGVNLFVQGVIEDAGCIVGSLDDAVEVLRAWR